jgi:hypothetical protein
MVGVSTANRSSPVSLPLLRRLRLWAGLRLRSRVWVRRRLLSRVIRFAAKFAVIIYGRHPQRARRGDLVFLRASSSSASTRRARASAREHDPPRRMLACRRGCFLLEQPAPRASFYEALALSQCAPSIWRSLIVCSGQVDSSLLRLGEMLPVFVWKPYAEIQDPLSLHLECEQKHLCGILRNFTGVHWRRIPKSRDRKLLTRSESL